MRKAERDLLELKVNKLKMVCGTIFKCIEKDIDTKGYSFDRNTQSYYYTQLGKLKEYIPYLNIEGLDAEDKVWSSINSLRYRTTGILILYEREEEFIANLNRKQMVIEAFRKEYDNPKYRELTDDILLNYYEREKEINVEGRNFYSSLFFEKVGFLEINYHYEIYLRAIQILKLLDPKGGKEIALSEDLFYRNSKPIFPMILIAKLHAKVNGIIIDNVDELTFLLEINYIKAISKVKIKAKNQNEFYYLIDSLSKCLPDINEREIWLWNILKDFNIKESTFKSKYRHITSSNATESQKSLSNAIDEVFKLYGA